MFYYKAIFWLVCLLGSFCSIYAQPFEGRVVYDVDVEVSEGMQKMGVTKGQLIDRLKEQGVELGVQTIWYSADGFYKQYFGPDNKGTYTIYRHDSNTLFYFSDTTDVISVRDASVSDIELEGVTEPTWKWVDTTVVFDGFSCQVLKCTIGRKITTYYFAEGHLPVNAEVYKGHIYGDWYGYLKLAGCLPLYFESDISGLMTLKHTLLNYQVMTLPKKVFLVPELTLGREARMLGRWKGAEKGIRYLEPKKSKKRK